jgi:hypothetical protein
MNKFMPMPNSPKYVVNTKFTEWACNANIKLMMMHNTNAQFAQICNTQVCNAQICKAT